MDLDQEADLLSNKTVLTESQAKAYLLREKGHGYTEISEEMGVSESTVDSTLRRARQSLTEASDTRRLIPHARTGDDRLAKTKTDVGSMEYLGLDWTEWLSSYDLRGSIEEGKPGIYRVRRDGDDELLYIGFSGDLKSDISFLSDVVSGTKKKSAHPAGELSNPSVGDIEFSACQPEITVHDQPLLGTAYACIAVYRYNEGESPDINFGGSIEDGSINRRVINPTSRSPESIRPMPRTRWEDVRSDEWMTGDTQSWSEPQPIDSMKSKNVYKRGGYLDFMRIEGKIDGELAEEDTPPRQVIYRVWDESPPRDTSYLTYIGPDISFNNVGLTEDSVISYIYIGEKIKEYLSELDDPGHRLRDRLPVDILNRTAVEMEDRFEELNRAYEEILVDLLGHHYLATGTLPVRQFSSVSSFTPLRRGYYIPRSSSLSD